MFGASLLHSIGRWKRAKSREFGGARRLQVAGGAAWAICGCNDAQTWISLGAAALSALEIAGVLVDLGGVVYLGDEPLPGALAAIERIRAADIPVRFLTNVTRQSHGDIVAKLRRMGVAIAPHELLTPSQMAVNLLRTKGARPHLLVHPNLMPDFADAFDGTTEAVVVGDAGEGVTYRSLNAAFRKLSAGAEFLALAANRNFMDADGALSIDAGAFVAALEYASGSRATVLGKPSPDFFRLAVESIGCAPADAVMIGDDAESDVAGALNAGLKAVLVRTGKYRPGQENALTRRPTYVADDLAGAVAWLLAPERR